MEGLGQKSTMNFGSLMVDCILYRDEHNAYVEPRVGRLESTVIAGS